MPARPPSDPTEIAGRYEVVQKLGAGAFGTVYKAKDKILGRMVAIKTIRLEGLAAAGASLDELMDRFKREAQVSAQLKHPHIVTIYDIGDADGLSYLAMEFIDGVGLDRVIATDGRLAVDRAASLAAQVADALDFAHRHNVVHRDIKPANIMVESGDRVKVTDFGIAKVIDSGEHLTVTGSLLGTPSYMSPEQAKGAAIDGRSDLFAVGCILYEMVTGKKAFRGESITGLIFKIITEEPPPIRELDPNVPEELVTIVGRALAKAPDARYQTGRELADDLLALSRAGTTPTLRQTEMDTASGVAATTLQAPPTMKAPPAGPSAEPTKLVPPPLPRPVDRTPAAAPPARPVRAAAAAPGRAEAPARKSGIGILVAIALTGLLLLSAAAVAAYFFLWPRFQSRSTEASPSVATTPATEAPAATLVGGPAATEPPAATPSAPPEAGSRTADAGAGTGPGSTTGGRTAPGPGSAGRPGAPSGPAGSGRTAEAPATAPPASMPSAQDAEADLSFLEREPPALEGREAGGRVADTYRRDRGTSFGTGRTLRRREPFPTNVKPPEMRAIAVLRNVIHFQEVFKQREGHYGNFKQTLPRAVPSGSSFQFHGYRFDLVSVDGDSFKVVATPLTLGLRGFVADDSGYVRFADE